MPDPTSEADLLGAHERFSEQITDSIDLLHRRLKTPLLRTEHRQIGSLSHTQVVLCYLSDRVPDALLQEVRTALERAELETVLSPGYLQPFLEQSETLFDTVSTTERPDVLATKLLEGRIAVMIDGSPFVLVVPKLLVESFQTLDDYSFKPWYATVIRWVKYFAVLLSTLLPALYVAVSVHHPELLNRTLLLLLTKAEADEPLSLPCGCQFRACQHAHAHDHCHFRNRRVHRPRPQPGADGPASGIHRDRRTLGAVRHLAGVHSAAV